MRYISIFIIALTSLSLSCNSSPKDEETSSERSVSVPTAGVVKIVKLTSEGCIDPDLSLVSNATQLMLCDGTIASGTYTPPTPDFPEVANVLTTDTVNGNAGTYTPPTPDFPDVGNVLPSDTVDGNAGTLVLPDPWDLRYGTTVGATTGKLKLNCRNMVGDYNGGTPTLSTVDDDNYDSGASGDFPSTNPWGSDEYFCGFNAPTDRTWNLVDDVTAGATEGDAIYRDRISSLKWTRGDPTVTKSWSDAITYCSGLTHGSGGDTWRLPTHKELMAAYEHGIHDLDSDHTDTDANPTSGVGDNLGDLDADFWSSSTRSEGTDRAWDMNFINGNTYHTTKISSISVLCVAP